MNTECVDGGIERFYFFQPMFAGEKDALRPQSVNCGHWLPVSMTTSPLTSAVTGAGSEIKLLVCVLFGEISNRFLS